MQDHLCQVSAFIALVVLHSTALELHAQEILLAAGSSQWAYWDEGVLADDSWKTVSFDDAVWLRGTAPLGYGDGDEATVVGYGGNATNKYITTWFRHDFEVEQPELYDALIIRLRRDDGAVVYLNGVEIIRDNMPEGDITMTTRARVAVGGADETAFQNYTVTEAPLSVGLNLVAVEVHQVLPTSSDISFDLEVVGEWVSLMVDGVFPVHQATVDPFSTPLAATLTDPIERATSLAVTFYSRAMGLPPGPDFWIIALPDTQYYTGAIKGGTPEMFVQQVEWIRAQQALRNIAFVTQLGDCVENGDKGGDDTEWRYATNALYRLETYISEVLTWGIPYGFAPGNHDMTMSSSNAPTSMFFNQYFGVQHFAGRDYYGGHYGTNNNNNYELFSASGLDFIIVHLEYDTTPEPALLAWADQLLQSYANRRAIIVSHYLIGTGYPGSFGPQGQAVYEALKGNPNLFLMLAGHVPGEGRRQDTWNGRTVHTLLADYQMRPNGGNGWLRILEFSPSNNVVRVRTYSPILDQYETDADSEFVWEYDLRQGDPFEEIGQVTGVVPGNQASLVWTNLDPGTSYEWYMQVSDGERTYISPVWGFTAGANPDLPLIQVLALDPIASEVGPCMGRFDILRSGNTNNELAILLAVGGSAICGVDFEDISHVVHLSAGDCSKQIVIMPRADNVAEGIEEVILELVQDASYVICSNACAVMLIADRSTDTDGDGMTDADEVAARTDWNDPDSVLRIETMRMVEGRVELGWSSVVGVTYRVCGKQDLSDGEWMDLSQDIQGDAGTTSWSESVDLEAASMFYGIRVVAALESP